MNRIIKKNVLLLLFTLLINLCYGQNVWLFNKGIVSYIDNNEGSYFAVSFKGDTVIKQDNESIYMIDSSIYQVHTFDISPTRIGMKYDTIMEYVLLDSIRNSEKEYAEQNYIKGPFRDNKESFRNINGKQFLLSYYEIPFILRSQSSKGIKSINIRPQYYLLLTIKS